MDIVLYVKAFNIKSFLNHSNSDWYSKFTFLSGPIRVVEEIGPPSAATGAGSESSKSEKPTGYKNDDK